MEKRTSVRLGQTVYFTEVPENSYGKSVYENFGYVTYIGPKSFFVLIPKPRKDDGLEIEFSYENKNDLEGVGFVLEELPATP